MVGVMEKVPRIVAECCACGYPVFEGEDHQARNVFCPRCSRPDLVPVKQLSLGLKRGKPSF